MQLFNHFPFITIMLPLAVSVLMLLIKGEKISRTISLFVQMILALLSLSLLLTLLQSPESTFTYNMGHFPAPWGNQLRAGPLEALMACAFSIVMFFSLLGGMNDTANDIKPGKIHYYYLMINLCTTSLMALVFTNDIFTGYVFIEINTLAACAIVVAKESGETVKATIKYMILSILGSGLFLLSTAMLYGITGHLLMEHAHTAIVGLEAAGQYIRPLTVTLILFCISIAVKSALFPFHTWLPDAHGYATTSSSAVLSGLILKGYIVLLLKLVTRVYGTEVVSRVLPALIALGLLSMLAGSIIAFMQNDIKRMIAYSSVAHIGYIFMGIGFNTPAAFAASSYHIIAHAFTKSMLFIAAGALINTAGSKNIFEMRGAALKNKLAGAAFIVGACSLIGIPFFAGFPSKFFLADAVMHGTGGRFIAVTVLALSTFLNALYYVPTLFKLYSYGGTAGLETGTMPAGKNKLSVSFTLVCLIAANIALGIFFGPLLSALEGGFAWLG
ncbi:MAG: hypothetical protein FWG46_02510 [Treponema sp.]|nr:hypothetical protein [Treponema sp.]